MLNLYVFWYGWYDTINNKKEHMIINRMLIITSGILVLILGLIFGVSYPEHQTVGILTMFGGLYCAVYGVGYDK